MNPILPNQYHVPDVEARQWQDGRMYLYGSMDVSGDLYYCSKEYHVFSSDNLTDWTDHGVSYQSDIVLYAPDCIYKDGKYWLFYCNMSNHEEVAVSDKPYGPFLDPKKVIPADGDAIDPAAFVDDDGEVYYFWGQHDLRGGRLSKDMTTLTEVNRSMLNEKEHGFHEGSSLRKRNGIYYMVFADTSRGKATCLGYATATHPLGPYTKRGIIIDNDGCDKETWNNHGSIAEFNGEWYVFYHRSSQGANCNRRVCMEPIQFLEDGSIPEVEMTTQGVTGPISAFKTLEAWRACLLHGAVQTQQLAIGGQLYEYLTSIANGHWACYKYIDFGDGATRFIAKVAGAGKVGHIRVRLDAPDGEFLGEIEVTGTGGWHEWRELSCEIKKVTGVHALYLEFTSWPGRLCNLMDFRFE